MVALADWYIIPILPQLGKLSGPSTGASYYYSAQRTLGPLGNILPFLKNHFSVINVYDIEKGDSDFAWDYALHRKTSVNSSKG